jgi:hypothetical protein
MQTRQTGFLTILMFSFIPWLLTQQALNTTVGVPRILFVFIHCALVVLFYGVSFAIFFRGRSASAFDTAAKAVVSVLSLEFLYIGFFYKGELWFLNYWDWIFPMFLIAAVVYGVGKVLKKEQKN